MEWLTTHFEEMMWPPTPQQQLNRASLRIERDTRRLSRVRQDCDARERAALSELRKLSTTGDETRMRAAARDVARVRSTRTQARS